MWPYCVVLAMFFCGMASGQIITGIRSTLTAGKSPVSYKDTIALAYTVEGYIPAGYYYVSVVDGRAKSLNDKPWHGFIAAKETKTIKLKVMFDCSYIRHLYGSKASILVGVTKKQNPGRSDYFANASVIIEISDPPNGELIIIEDD